MQHPFRCGLALAIVLVGVTAVLDFPDLTAIYHGTDENLLLLALGVAVGAFAASVPGRVRRRGQPWEKLSWPACAHAFVCGTVMLMALRLMGMSDAGLAVGVMQGGVGALACMGVVLLTACVAARWMEGRAS